MAFHRVITRAFDRDHLLIGITAGNLTRLESGPIEFDATGEHGTIACVLRLDTQSLPHPGRLAITLTADDVETLLRGEPVEWSRAGATVRAIYGRTPWLAWRAMFPEPLQDIPADPADERVAERWVEPDSA